MILCMSFVFVWVSSWICFVFSKMHFAKNLQCVVVVRFLSKLFLLANSHDRRICTHTF